MKRFTFLLVALSFLLLSAAAQNKGKWHSYLAANNTTLVAEGNEYVFAVADGSLFSYGKEDNSLHYYSKENGLSDNQITNIAFHAGSNTLVVVYSNGNIDLTGEDNSVYNLPFLMNSSSVQDKTVHSIYLDKEMAYLSTAFGIVALNVKKKEIKETYRLNEPVSSVCILREDIYALVKGSILKASLKDNLIDPANWHAYPLSLSGTDSIQQIGVFQNTLCLLAKGKGVYYLSGNSFVSLLEHGSLVNIKTENGKLTAFSASELYVYHSFTERDRGNMPGISDISSLKDAQTFWLATGTGGMTGISRTGANQYSILVNINNHDGPKRNWDAFMKMHNNKLYIAGGGRWTNRFWNAGTVMTYDTDSLKWNNLKNIDGFLDATCIAVDPDDENHYFVSSWGEGVFEFKDGQLIQHYDHRNSALSTIYPNSSSQYNYVRAEGVCFDNQKNLWMTNTGVADVIVVRKADGTWAKLGYSAISNPTLADKILIASNGHKWVNLVRADKSGLFVFDDNGTIDNTADDRSHYYNFLTDDQGNNIGISLFLCITEDKNGAIWIGSNRGVAIVSVPSRGVEGTMSCRRITQKDENGALDYFLKDERINAIAVDGANRKWLGTESSGIYLVNEDGTTLIEHFTETNSPLLSNTIQSIAINDRSGEVFIGTNKGLISYMGDATKGSENYSNVYAYPNPVRPDFDQQVVITGLMQDSNVKITDLNGHLLAEGKSTGGQFSWNCRNASGKAVVPGIYLVLSSSPQAKESVVTKIAVIR